MPTDFPDLASLERATKIWKFRTRLEGETEAEYREALATFVEPRDFIESMEIRKGKGWNRFSDDDNRDMLRRRGFPV